MRTATVELESITPYSQSRYHGTDKLDKENAEAYEARTWRNRCHVNADGVLFIPPMAFKNCVAEAAKYLSMPIPGKARRTFTKHFLSGILVSEETPLEGFTKDGVPGEWLFMNANGQKGPGPRVLRCYPRIDKWKVTVAFHILDETITESAFAQTLETAGSLIGIGRFRPANGGYFGRFRVVSLDWGEDTAVAA